MNALSHYAPKYFKAYEFVPPGIHDWWGDRALEFFIDVRVLITADTIREFFGAPVTANNWFWLRQHGVPLGKTRQYSGYRPDSYYYTDPGSASQHRFGRALDCLIRGCTAEHARRVIMAHPHLFPHIRRIEDGVDWLHFDVANTGHDGIQLFRP